MPTLSQWQTHFFQMYGRRNSLFIDGLRERVGFLLHAIGDLQDVIRKGGGEETKNALASTVGWTFCVAGHFGNLPLAEMMASKYPVSGCVYCGHLPCDCHQGQRSAVKLVIPHPQQFDWSLTKWQTHLDRVYGARNRQIGLENALNRLFKEVCEINELQMGLARTEATVEEMEHEFALKVVDILVWIIAVAYLLGLDLERAVSARYGARCPTCLNLPCACGRFIIDQGRLRRIGANTAAAK